MDTNKRESGMNTGRVSSFLCGLAVKFICFAFSQNDRLSPRNIRSAQPRLYGAFSAV
jgi:hypothetical protein